MTTTLDAPAPVRAPVSFTRRYIAAGTFILLGLASDSTWAMLAGTLGPGLRDSGRLTRWQPRVSGCLFIGLGLAAADTAGPSSRS